MHEQRQRRRQFCAEDRKRGAEEERWRIVAHKTGVKPLTLTLDISFPAVRPAHVASILAATPWRARQTRFLVAPSLSLLPTRRPSRPVCCPSFPTRRLCLPVSRPSLPICLPSLPTRPRRVCIIVFGFQIGVLMQEYANNLGVAEKQEADKVSIIVPHSEQQRRIAVAVLVLDVGTGLEKNACHTVVDTFGRQHQSSEASDISCVEVEIIIFVMLFSLVAVAGTAKKFDF